MYISYGAVQIRTFKLNGQGPPPPPRNRKCKKRNIYITNFLFLKSWIHETLMIYIPCSLLKQQPHDNNFLLFFVEANREGHCKGDSNERRRCHPLGI